MTPFRPLSGVSPQKQSSPVPFLLILLVIAGALGYFSYKSHHATSEVLDDSSRVAKQFLDDLSRGSYTAANALLSGSARASNSAQTLQQAVSAFTDRYGSWIGSSQTHFETRNLGGLDTCKLAYKLHFQRGSAHMQLILVRSYKGWSIDSFSFS